MIYCINPDCKHRQNIDELEYCKSCGTPLLIKGRYRLLKPLRRLDPRSYTNIFEVDDEGTRKVIKILKDNSSQLIKMFEREAYTLQILNHPGIPKVDIDGYFTFTPKDSTQELHCLVMEKIEGQNLENWLAKNKPISQSQAINWLRQLIEILEQIHQQGFFHRDIKPSNIMLQPDGQLALIDFGSVRDISDTYLAKIKVKNGLNITTIFSGGYTPQEQVDGKATPQSDLFALGRTFVHLLTGKSPVELPTNRKTGKLIWQDQAPQISKPLADFIDDLMAHSPADRPQDTTVILRDLTAKGLFRRSLIRFIDSPKFKVLTLGLGILIIAGIVINYFSVPLQAKYNHEEGRANINAKRLNEARKYLQKSIEFDSNNAVSRNDLGFVCQEQKDYECALSEYQQALKITSNAANRATIHYNLGIFHEQISKVDEALKHYQSAMQVNGEIGVTATNDYARLQIKDKRDYLSAIDLTLKALERKGLNWKENSDLRSSLYKNLGWAYLQQGQVREAEKSLREAIHLDKSKRAAPHCLLAKVLQDNNKIEALSSWQKCRDYDSKELPEVETWQLDADRYLKAKAKKP